MNKMAWGLARTANIEWRAAVFFEWKRVLPSSE